MVDKNIEGILKNLAPDAPVEVVSPLLFNVGHDDKGTTLQKSFGHEITQRTIVYFERVERLPTGEDSQNYARFYRSKDTEGKMYERFLVATSDISDVRPL